MFVVATENFELYHDAVAELRERGVTFTTVEPGDPLPEGTDVVLSAPDDEPPANGTVDHVVAELGESADDDPESAGSDVDADTDSDTDTNGDPNDADPDAVGNGPEDAGDGRADDDRDRAPEADPVRRAVEEGLALLRGGDDRVVVGVDPGDQPGVAVLAGETVVAAFQVPRGEVADVVRREVDGAADPLVRVGDGARLSSARIVNRLDDVAVELVDETGTTPSLGTGARGMGDVLAAVNIARRSGERVDGRAVEPTAGELQRIKDRSRERAADDRAIDESLARRVAVGELTVEEALSVHRNGGNEGDDEESERED
ncbi:MAG: hypothetical protein ABEJ79_12230 [Halolamina sp.]